MKRPIRPARLCAAAGVLAAVIAATPGVDVAHAGPADPDVPSTIDVDAGNKVFLVGHAIGVQIYSCTAGASGPRWQFAGPRADLFGDNGKLIATHFGGPTWRARDGSTVVAQRVDGVTVDPNAIPWLLLKATSATPGADGDRLAHTTFIQRIATTGGREPPAANCDATTAGTTAEVPYTADYYFWKSTAS